MNFCLVAKFLLRVEYKLHWIISSYFKQLNHNNFNDLGNLFSPRFTSRKLETKIIVTFFINIIVGNTERQQCVPSFDIYTLVNDNPASTTG